MEIDYLKLLYDKYGNRINPSVSKFTVNLGTLGDVITYNAYFKPHIHYKHGLSAINNIFKEIYYNCELVNSLSITITAVNNFLGYQGVVFSGNKNNIDKVKDIKVDKLHYCHNMIDNHKLTISNIVRKSEIISRLYCDLKDGEFCLKFPICKFSINGIIFKIIVTEITDPLNKSDIFLRAFDIKAIKVSSCVNISFPGIKNWTYIDDYCPEVIPPWLQYLGNCDSIGEIFTNLDKEISKLESKLEYKKLKDLCI